MKERLKNSNILSVLSFIVLIAAFIGLIVFTPKNNKEEKLSDEEKVTENTEEPEEVIFVEEGDYEETSPKAIEPSPDTNSNDKETNKKDNKKSNPNNKETNKNDNKNTNENNNSNNNETTTDDNIIIDKELNEEIVISLDEEDTSAYVPKTIIVVPNTNGTYDEDDTDSEGEE